MQADVTTISHSRSAADEQNSFLFQNGEVALAFNYFLEKLLFKFKSHEKFKTETKFLVSESRSLSLTNGQLWKLAHSCSASKAESEWL